MIQSLQQQNKCSQQIIQHDQKQIKDIEFQSQGIGQQLEQIKIQKQMFGQQQDDEVLFQQFIKGIPDQCVRQVRMQMQNLPFQNQNQPDHKIEQIPRNKEIQNICDIQQLSGISSISLNQQNSDEKKQINDKNQLKKQKLLNQDNFCQNSSQKVQSQVQSQLDDQNLPFNAGFGDFLKQMQRLAKDVSFQDQTHDIWNQNPQNQTVQLSQKQTKQSLSSLIQSKVQSTYVIDFSEDKIQQIAQDKPFQSLITQVQQAYKYFLKKQYPSSEDQTILSQKQHEYTIRLKEVVMLGQQILKNKHQKTQTN